MAEATPASVRAYFDREAALGRRLLPDTGTVSGLGTYRKYRQAVGLMADPAVSSVLDVGCNRGSIEFLFCQLYPEKAQRTRVYGIDISTEAIRQARELQLPTCDFRAYDGVTLPYPTASHDLVIMVEVIEHVVHKEQLLREVWRVLKPSGRLFLTTPNAECWPLRIELTAWSILRALFRRPVPAKDAFVTHRALATLLDSVGFRAADRCPMFAWPHLFVHFLGWGLLPPLPPKALYWYQQTCLRVWDRVETPVWVDRRFKWSLVALLAKGALPE